MTIRGGFLMNKPDPKNPTGAHLHAVNTRKDASASFFFYPQGLWLHAEVSAQQSLSYFFPTCKETNSLQFSTK